jgi:hypothetical protein
VAVFYFISSSDIFLSNYLSQINLIQLYTLISFFGFSFSYVSLLLFVFQKKEIYLLAKTLERKHILFSLLVYPFIIFLSTLGFIWFYRYNALIALWGVLGSICYYLLLDYILKLEDNQYKNFNSGYILNFISTFVFFSFLVVWNQLGLSLNIYILVFMFVFLLLLQFGLKSLRHINFSIMMVIGIIAIITLFQVRGYFIETGVVKEALYYTNGTFLFYSLVHDVENKQLNINFIVKDLITFALGMIILLYV